MSDYGTADYTDGNELAGPMSEIFAIDVTVTEGRCAGCGWAGPMASLRLYRHAPGWVARCPGCDDVMLRLVRGPDTAWLDLRGVQLLRMPMPAGL